MVYRLCNTCTYMSLHKVKLYNNKGRRMYVVVFALKFVTNYVDCKFYDAKLGPFFLEIQTSWRPTKQSNIVNKIALFKNLIDGQCKHEVASVV